MFWTGAEPQYQGIAIRFSIHRRQLLIVCVTKSCQFSPAHTVTLYPHVSSKNVIHEIQICHRTHCTIGGSITLLHHHKICCGVLYRLIASAMSLFCSITTYVSTIALIPKVFRWVMS